jgi:hypothetical protein
MYYLLVEIQSFVISLGVAQIYSKWPTSWIPESVRFIYGRMRILTEQSIGVDDCLCKGQGVLTRTQPLWNSTARKIVQMHAVVEFLLA